MRAQGPERKGLRGAKSTHNASLRVLTQTRLCVRAISPPLPPQKKSPKLWRLLIKQIHKQTYNEGELFEKEMEADVGFLLGPEKPKALTCRKPRSPPRRVCLERFASAREAHGCLLCSPAGLRPCVLYHYRQLILHQPYFKFSKPTI